MNGNLVKPTKQDGTPRKLLLPKNTCWRCGKGKNQRGQDCKAAHAICREYRTKGHFGKVCLNSKKASSHSIDIPQASKLKHLIRFPVILSHKMENSTFIPLKADTGADVNFIKSKTFDLAFGIRKNLL